MTWLLYILLDKWQSCEASNISLDKGSPFEAINIISLDKGRSLEAINVIQRTNAVLNWSNQYVFIDQRQSFEAISSFIVLQTISFHKRGHHVGYHLDWLLGEEHTNSVRPIQGISDDNNLSIVCSWWSRNNHILQPEFACKLLMKCSLCCK